MLKFILSVLVVWVIFLIVKTLSDSFISGWIGASITTGIVSLIYASDKN